MIVIDFLQHVVVTILIGYIGLTSSLATYVEEIVSSENSEEGVVMTTEKTFVDRFTEAVASAERFSSALPRVLLDNTTFQLAAVVASTQAETSPTLNTEIPLEQTIREALVNVYCQYKTDTYIRTTTGTGFFINQKGIILTNAHVAQFLLLEGVEDIVNDVVCIIREGNPATPKYKAELLYISPKWILENADLIDIEEPQGTGERDYALLYVSEALDGSPLPTHFPTILTNTNLLSRSVIGTTVFSAGYPAEKLIRNGPDAKLEPVIAEASIGTLYTFGSNYADIFSVSDSPVGEQGASGGPVINPTDGAIGLIVTKGDMESEGVHSLRALTLSYVDRTIQEETGFTLAQNMLGDITLRGDVFKEAIVPFLAELLTNELRN